MIRPATEEDFAAIEAMSERFWEETWFNVPYKKDSALPYIEAAHDYGLLFVAVKGDIIGFSAGVCTPLMGNSDYLQGVELAWWMAPEHRKSKDGIRLLEALEHKAKEIGCTFWSMIALDSSMPETVKNIYQRRGYVPQEQTFSKRLR